MNKLSFPTVKLGRFIKQIKTKVKDTDLSQKELTVYGVTNKNGITITNNKSSEDLSNYIVVGKNQFVYNPYRVNVGSIGLTEKDIFGVVSPAYIVFETTEDLSSDFLLYYLKSALGINLIKWYGDRGGVRSALSFKDLKEIDIPDMPLAKQLILLDKMRKIDTLLNSLIEENNISLEHISNLRQSILQRAVEGKLSVQSPDDEPASVLLEKIKAEKEKMVAEKKLKKQTDLPPIIEKEKLFNLPEGWVWCKLGEITDIFRGSSPRPKGSPLYWSDQKTEYHWITISDISNYCISGILCDTREFLTKAGSLISTPVKKNDLIIAVSGSTTGKSCISGMCGYIYDGLACIRIINVNSGYKYLHIFIQYLYQQINNSKTGSAFPNINTDMLKNILFPLPPLAEQQRIIDKVDSLMVLCDEIEQEASNSKKYTSQLMEAVLQETFATSKEEKKNNVIDFIPNQQTKENNYEWSAAARGKLKESTWRNLIKRADALANEG